MRNFAFSLRPSRLRGEDSWLQQLPGESKLLAVVTADPRRT
jgi:hypothetical protein